MILILTARWTRLVSHRRCGRTAQAEALQTRIRKEEEYREEQRKRAEDNAIKRKEKAERKKAEKAQKMAAEAEEAGQSQVPPPSVKSASGTRSTDPPARGSGDTKQDKEQERSERLRQRKIDQAREMLSVAMEAMTVHGVRCVSVLRCV